MFLAAQFPVIQLGFFRLKALLLNQVSTKYLFSRVLAKAQKRYVGSPSTFFTIKASSSGPGQEIQFKCGASCKSAVRLGRSSRRAAFTDTVCVRRQGNTLSSGFSGFQDFSLHP